MGELEQRLREGNRERHADATRRQDSWSELGEVNALLAQRPDDRGLLVRAFILYERIHRLTAALNGHDNDVVQGGGMFRTAVTVGGGSYEQKRHDIAEIANRHHRS